MTPEQLLLATRGKQFNPGGVAHLVSSKVATAKDIYVDIKEWEIGLRFLCSLCFRMSKGVCVVVCMPYVAA